MGLFDFFTKKQKFGKPSKAYGQVFLRDIGIVAWDDARESYWIEEGYKKNPTVQAIVSQAAKAAGSIPWVVKRKSDGKPVKRVDPILKEMLYKPNGTQTWNDFIQETIVFKMVNGNAFIWGIKPENENSINSAYYQYLRNLPSHLVQIYSDGKDGISHYNLDYRWTDKPIPAKDVYHIKTPNPDYDETGSFLYGQSPLESCRRSIDVNNQCIDAMQSLMLNLGPPGILGMKGEGAENMDEVQMKKVEAKLRNYRGSNNFGDFPINNMEWVWTQLGNDPSKLMIMQKYESTQIDICNAFNFPYMLIKNASTFNNQNEAKKAMWEHTIIPNLTEIRDALNCWWIPQFGEDMYIDYDLSDVRALQQDKDVQANRLMKLSHVMTINEIRAELGLELREDGDVYAQNQNTEDAQESATQGAAEDQEVVDQTKPD